MLCFLSLMHLSYALWVHKFCKWYLCLKEMIKNAFLRSTAYHRDCKPIHMDQLNIWLIQWKEGNGNNTILHMPLCIGNESNNKSVVQSSMEEIKQPVWWHLCNCTASEIFQIQIKNFAFSLPPMFGVCASEIYGANTLGLSNKPIIL